MLRIQLRLVYQAQSSDATHHTSEVCFEQELVRMEVAYEFEIFCRLC